MLTTATAVSAVVKSVSGLPDEVLNRAIMQAPADRPIQFICNADGSVIVCSLEDVKAEIAVRKLNKEVATTRFYDKEYVRGLASNVGFQSEYFDYNKLSNMVMDNRLMGWNTGCYGRPKEEAPKDFEIVESPESYYTFFDRVYKFFDKFSIKFTTGIKNEPVKATAGNEGKISEVVLDTRTGPAGTGEEISRVEKES